MGIFGSLNNKPKYYDDSQLLQEKGVTSETLENLSNNAGDDEDEVVENNP